MSDSRRKEAPPPQADVIDVLAEAGEDDDAETPQESAPSPRDQTGAAGADGLA